MNLDFLSQNNSGLGMNVLISAGIVLVVYYGSAALKDKLPVYNMINSAMNSLPDSLGSAKLPVVGLVLVVVLTMLLSGLRNNKMESVLEEGFEGEVNVPQEEQYSVEGDEKVDMQKEEDVKNAQTPVESNEIYSSIEGQINTENKFPKDCFPKDQLQPKELLPGDYESSWKEVAPNNPGALEDQNMLEAAYHVGVNTVGQTLRNANLQLRSEPANPQVKVSPWMQTTIDPDTNRQLMEIGSDCNKA